MEPTPKESLPAKTVLAQQSPVLQIPPVLLSSSGSGETIVQNVGQTVPKDSIKIPVVARPQGLSQQPVAVTSREEPPLKKAKMSSSSSSPVFPKGIISPQTRFSNPAVVAIDQQLISNSSIQAQGATAASSLFQQGFQTVFLQPTAPSSHTAKPTTTAATRVTTTSQPAAANSQVVIPPKVPLIPTKPILMHAGLSNKIVVHAPSSQTTSGAVSTTNSKPVSLPVGQLGTTTNQTTIQTPVLGPGRLLQVASAGGSQKYILVPPGATPQSMHLIGSGSQLSLPAGMTVTTVAGTTPEDTSAPHGKFNFITTSQGSVGLQMSQTTPVIIPNSVQSLAKSPQVTLASTSVKNKLPANVQARYVPKTQMISTQQVSTSSALKSHQHQGKILTVGQRVGAITNLKTSADTKGPGNLKSVFTSTGATSGVPVVSNQSSDQSKVQTTMTPMTLPNGQQSIVLHAGNLTKQLMNGTPVIFNIPGSGKHAQTAILMPPSGRNNQPMHTKIFKKQTSPPVAVSSSNKFPSGHGVAVAVSIQGNTAPASTLTINGEKAITPSSSILSQSTPLPSVTVQSKVKTVASVQAPSVVTTSSLLTTQSSVKTNITRAVPVTTLPIMTTAMVQNGRLLQLLPAQPGPVMAASQPKMAAGDIKTAVSVDPPFQVKLQETEEEQEVSTIDLALKWNAPYPQAYTTRPEPKKEAKKSGEDGDKPASSTEVKPLHGKTTEVLKAPVEEETVDFTWEEYLEITGTVAAPSHSFKHVDLSLSSVVKTGMKVEAPNQPSKLNPYHTYWVASVISSCGSLLLLRYEGYGDDRSGDFWCDVKSKDLHPVGWCARNGQMLQPPDALLHKKLNWQQFLITSLTGAKTIPYAVLSGSVGPLPTDRLLKGHYLDVIDEEVPTQAWIACIIENYGGRLKLRYSGAKEPDDFYLFYLSYRLHPPGWAKEHRVIIKPPKFILAQTPVASDSNWRSMYFGVVAAANLSNSLPHDFFKVRKVFSKIRINNMKEGMKIEAINPKAPHQICPATIIKNFNSHFFQVQIDNLDRVDKERITFVCHAESGGIFPVNWCEDYGFNITPPKGYDKPKFKWSEYLKQQDSKPAPAELFRTKTERKFQNGMKLEAVNPFTPSQICVATITKIAGRHIWLHFDGSKQPNHIVDAESQDIFPVGWCDSVGYPLRSPKKLMAQKKKVAIVWPEKRILTGPSPGRDLYQRVQEANQYEDSEEGWMPKVHINHKCFSGPFLNKGRLAELPRSTGPGMVTLVLREVLASLINSAYKPNRVLRELQVQNEVTAGMNGYLQIMKAKYKGKSYRALVELPKTVPKVLEFLRQTLIKLECCPNLVSLTPSGDTCPENCVMNTKTKYNTSYGGKRKKKALGRPPSKKRLLMTSADSSHKKDEEDTTKPPVFAAVPPQGQPATTNEHPVPPAPIKAVKTPLMTRARHIVQTAKLAKTTPRLILPDRKRRGINMMKLTANLRSSRPRKNLDPPVKKTQAVVPKVAKKPVGKSTKTKESSPPAKSAERLALDTNPLEWTVAEVEKFIKDTDCAPLAKIFKEQEIDGQALLLLTLPTVQECMDLKLGPAIKLCHHIERIKIAFYEQFAK